jgi:hypothetical protein
LKAPPGWQDLHLAGAAAVLAVSMALAALGWLTGADSRPAEGPESDRPVLAKPAASTGTGINRS